MWVSASLLSRHAPVSENSKDGSALKEALVACAGLAAFAWAPGPDDDGPPAGLG